MTVLDVLRALRRHPVVLVACLIASINAGIAVWLGVPTSYQADSSLVLLSPSVVSGPDGEPIKINPWERAGDTPSQVMASALASVAVSPSFVDQLGQLGVTSTTAVEVALSGGGVVLNLTTINRDPQAASSDLQVLSTEVRRTLADRQRQVGAPATSLLRTDELTSPGPPLPLTGSRVKLAGVTLVLAVIFSVLIILWIDSRGRRARLRRRPAVKARGKPKPALPKAERGGRGEQPAPAVPVNGDVSPSAATVRIPMERPVAAGVQERDPRPVVR